jgi:acyl carrier protein
MPKRDEKRWEHERAAFEQDIAAAREALADGDLKRAVKVAVDPAHNYWYAEEAARLELLHDLYKLIPHPIEIRLAKIWAEVLSVKNIGRDDDFFELGGDSLRALGIIARISSEFTFEAPVTLMFESPTIKLLAQRIASRTISINTRTETLEENYRETPWGKLIDEVYAIGPKVTFAGAILVHDFPEAAVKTDELLARLGLDGGANQRINETTVTGAESIQFAKYRTTFLGDAWGAFSRGRHWQKFWDLGSGEVIQARERDVTMLASSISRDAAHVLISYSFIRPKTEETCWSTTRCETYRKARVARAGTYEKSEYKNAKYYTVRGELVLYQREEPVEIDRKEFEANPIPGEILPARTFEWAHSAEYDEYIRREYPPERAEEIFRENALDEERASQSIRLNRYQTITLKHDEIKGYLPAQTTTFVARDLTAERVTVYDAAVANGGISPYRIKAKLGVEDGESWIEEIIAPGHAVGGLQKYFTSPVTAVLISSDGKLGLANGLESNFCVGTFGAGGEVREFKGHTGRVTCLSISDDGSVIASGSEDKTVRLWQTSSAESTATLRGHQSVISKVCISLDATRVLSADRGGVIKLWDVSTGECLTTIVAHRENITGLCFIDGKFAASGSWDKTVKIWNLIDGSCLKTFEFDDWVTSVDMTPDGRFLGASSYEGTRVWELIWDLSPRDVDE